jgi:hypothetical protein
MVKALAHVYCHHLTFDMSRLVGSEIGHELGMLAYS